tara:strand:+ start:2073 stop:5837 length:3765 start_codon:yes stop_codon:yes gene_type:complete
MYHNKTFNIIYIATLRNDAINFYICSINIESMNYRKINNWVGIAVLVIASFVFISTVEPSTSLWDCGEYITTSNKLEVGHPPGAPTFMMIGRIFSSFVSQENAAYMINSISALSSALTILFLFWTITHLARKIVLKDEEETTGAIIAIMGAGLVGSFAYMFSDSFWFSAEEGEVYAMSSFFTALTFWAILKWEDNYEKVSSDRWIILIFFLVGISVGVHLLNLLVIPAAGFVYYFKKYKFTIKGFLLTGVVSVLILGLLNSVFFPKTLAIADFFERSFIGMGFNVGTMIFFLFLGVILGGLIWYSYKNDLRLMHTITMSLTVMIIGFSTFAMVVVRSNANPPLDENNPETMPSLMSYFGREQYGDWALVNGEYWNSPGKVNTGQVSGHKYFKAFSVTFKGKKYSFQTKFAADEFIAKTKMASLEPKEEYIITGDKYKLQFPDGNKDQYTLLPRMFDTRKDKIKGYMYWTDYTYNRTANPDRAKYMRIRAKDPKIKNSDGSFADAYIPTNGENFKYFKDYQMGWMYFRYFMWNFAGRQNDLQGHNQYYQGDGMIYKGALSRGNWLSGVNFIDKERVGTQNNLPQTMKSYEAYNTYYYLPLILGLIGLIFMIVKMPKDAFSIFLLFFFTGIAIMLYLNPRPYEPRERDYSVAASFYAFSIWIGFGVIAIYKWAKAKNLGELKVGILAVLGAGVFFYLIEIMNGSSHELSYSVLFMSVIGILMIVVPFFLNKALRNDKSLAIAATVIALFAPILMGVQNWDDHDRSDRYFAREIAKNYLNTCDKDAILFCFGDNDTFPLWYAQEVEGIRTDMKVMNYSLLSSDWHYNQLKKQTYEAAPINTILDEPDFRAGTRDIIIFSANNQAISARAFMDYMKKGRDQSPQDAKFGYGRVPYNKIYVNVDKDACVRNGLVREDQRNLLVDKIEWTLGGRFLTKADLAIIDILAGYEWKRPLCFTSTAIQGANRGLSKYLQREGMTAKFVPIIKPAINREKMYSLLMGEQKDLNGDGIIDGYNWGNIEKEEVFADYYTLRMIRSARMHYMQLAESYVNAALSLERNAGLDSTSTNGTLAKEYREKAINVLDKQYEVFPIKSCKIDELVNYIAMMYYRAGDTTKGDLRCSEVANYYSENITYFANQNKDYITVQYQEIGDFVNYFEALKQGSSDEKFDLKNFNPEGYSKLALKIQEAALDNVNPKFGQILRNDIANMGRTRRSGIFSPAFYSDAVPMFMPDYDKDGVSDYVDKCPQQAGSPEKAGCP